MKICKGIKIIQKKNLFPAFFGNENVKINHSNKHFHSSWGRTFVYAEQKCQMIFIFIPFYDLLAASENTFRNFFLHEKIPFTATENFVRFHSMTWKL